MLLSQVEEVNMPVAHLQVRPVGLQLALGGDF